MANNTRYYFSLPTEAPERSRSASRRPPLTPSTVSSPCLTTLVPVASRRDSGSSGSPTKASTLLAKVVSSPTTPRGETPVGSPMPSPESRMHSSPTYSSERPQIWRSESERYVRQYKQQDGYISFPDFEKFCQSRNSYDQQREHTVVKT
ncbi:uncharacterized protein K460DRAFT_401029 [Cucurbitaria berberidis CBS 394.84]|uniref:EF-hand domain-containing protein n=1 Tax=Cucurbitaria berberidis CBS 394.84 TaxID=1168544 RepID=A0A9P4GT44_9PLEO|nr:uncharacterized protein K460DRAFT_401029 [Cucurbitaria berberidis CBS 394.84]KAF1850996.1 hypothetical protein K460DRAFT_401029 [Cucurbitaria berberidis CBS 394.84]